MRRISIVICPKPRRLDRKTARRRPLSFTHPLISFPLWTNSNANSSSKSSKSSRSKKINPEDIVDSEPLFGEGLGLDSIDALELIVLMEKNYGIRLNNPAEGKAIFASLDTMADYIAQHRTK